MASLARARSELVDHQKVADDIMQKANQYAAGVKADADAEAERIRELVAKDAENAINVALSQAKSIVEKAQAEAAASFARKRDIDALAEQVTAQRDAAQRELAELTAKIDAAKAEVKRMLGA